MTRDSLDVISERFTDETWNVLGYALRESLQLGEGFIAPEHILLAIAREGKSVGAQVLRSLNIERRTLTTEIVGRRASRAAARKGKHERS